MVCDVSLMLSESSLVERELSSAQETREVTVSFMTSAPLLSDSVQPLSIDTTPRSVSVRMCTEVAMLPISFFLPTKRSMFLLLTRDSSPSSFTASFTLRSGFVMRCAVANTASTTITSVSTVSSMFVRAMLLLAASISAEESCMVSIRLYSGSDSNAMISSSL